MAGRGPQSKTCFTMLFPLLTTVGGWYIWKCRVIFDLDDINFLTLSHNRSIVSVYKFQITQAYKRPYICKRVHSIRIQPWKEELFRNSLREKCALCFKIVLMYGISRLVLLVCLESQFKPINRFATTYWYIWVTNVRQIGNCATTFDRPQNHSKALVSLNLFSVFTFFLGLSKKSYLRQP